MTTILPLQIVGETWYNKDSLAESLAQLPLGSDVVIDANSEGPALTPFGVLDLLTKFPHNYSFTKWSNPIEPVPYPRIKCSERSHFLTMSWRYWVDEIENLAADKVFGLFIGRHSVARNCIMYDVVHTWPDQFLLSKMTLHNYDPWNDRKHPGCITIETLDQWGSEQRAADIKQWADANPIPSLDNLHVKDYYKIPEISSAECARSLLSYYDQFNIELICETYTHGTTFFPTEKTVRPIIGNKPFLVFGPVDYLKNLQQLGFKTFGDVWDESYDSYGGYERWLKMQKVIDFISAQDRSARQALLNQCAHITRYNRKRLREIINDYKEF
jgi:hypothetical protein